MPMISTCQTEKMKSSALREIIIEYCQVAKDHPDALGEILRAWAFPGDGTGCYSNFDVRKDFVEVQAGPREFELLFGRPLDEDEGENSWGWDDRAEMKRILWYKHPSGIEMGYHWDGDGCLGFFVPELIDEYYNGMVVNHDCKKDHDWRFEEHNEKERRARMARP